MTREEAIDFGEMWLELQNDSKDSNTYEFFVTAIKALEQEPKWISVSERLPNLDDFSGSRVWQKKVLITGYLSFDDTKELFVSEAFAEDVIYNSVHDTVVTAWIPLPEPYKV